MSQHTTSDTRTVLPLLDGHSTLEIRPAPTGLVARRAATREITGMLYVICGVVGQFHGAYVGQSRTLSSRAAQSFKQWVTVQKLLAADTLVLVRSTIPWDHNLQLHVEARIAMALSTDGLMLLNTHTSARAASRRLTRSQVLLAEDLAREIVYILRTRVFANRRNFPPGPPANSREAAVRAVLAADRALDTTEVVAAVVAAGHLFASAITPDRSLRRDLTRRERGMRGEPRIRYTMHRYRPVYWGPHLTKRAAIAGYDRAHPRRR